MYIIRITALYRQLGCAVRTAKMDTLSAAMQESVRQSLHFIGLSSMPPQSVLVATLTVKGVRAKRGSAAGDDSSACVGEEGEDGMSSTLKGEVEEEDDDNDGDVVEVKRGGGGANVTSGSTSWMTGKTGGSDTSHKRVKSEPTARADESADTTGGPPSAKRARREEASSDPQQQALERRVEAIARGLKRGLTRTHNRF